MPDMVAVCKSGKVACERYNAREDGCMYSDEKPADMLPLAEFPNCPWTHKQKRIVPATDAQPKGNGTVSTPAQHTCPKHGAATVTFAIGEPGKEPQLGPYCCLCLDEVLGTMLPKCVPSQPQT